MLPRVIHGLSLASPPVSSAATGLSHVMIQQPGAGRTILAPLLAGFMALGKHRQPQPSHRHPRPRVGKAREDGVEGLEIDLLRRHAAHGALTRGSTHAPRRKATTSATSIRNRSISLSRG